MDVLIAIDKLDDLVHNARPVPLTDIVRLRRADLERRVEEVKQTLGPLAGTDELVARLDRFVASGKRVPLTGEHRYEKEELFAILDGLRAAVTPGSGEPPAP